MLQIIWHRKVVSASHISPHVFVIDRRLIIHRCYQDKKDLTRTGVRFEKGRIPLPLYLIIHKSESVRLLTQVSPFVISTVVAAHISVLPYYNTRRENIQ